MPHSFRDADRRRARLPAARILLPAAVRDNGFHARGPAGGPLPGRSELEVSGLPGGLCSGQGRGLPALAVSHRPSSLQHRMTGCSPGGPEAAALLPNPGAGTMPLFSQPRGTPCWFERDASSGPRRWCGCRRSSGLSAPSLQCIATRDGKIVCLAPR